jgi:hypothetical protein
METSMKSLLVGAALLATVAPQAFAQSQSPSQNQTSAKATVNQGQNLAAAQKIRQDLQSAGFKDVKVVAESFVVQAKSRDGDPVLMTIGPHGMSVFETENINNSEPSSTSTTGSSNGHAATGSQQ